MTHNPSGGPMADSEQWPDQRDVLGNKLPGNMKDKELHERLQKVYSGRPITAAMMTSGPTPLSTRDCSKNWTIREEKSSNIMR